MKSIKFFFRWLKGNLLLVALIITIITTLQYTRLLIPVFSQHVIDGILSGEASRLPAFLKPIIEGGTLTKTLIMTCVCLFLVYCFRSALIWCNQVCRNILGERVSYKLRNALYSHLQDLPYSYHKKSETGDLIQRCTTDVTGYTVFVSSKMFEIIRIVILIGLAMYNLIALKPQLAIVACVTMPILFLLALIFFRIEKKIYKKVEEAEGKMTNSIQENLAGVRVVKAFAREQFELDKFEKTSQDYKSKEISRVRKVAIYWGLSDFLIYTQLGLTVFFGVYLISKGELTVGEFSMFYLTSRMIIFPVRELGRLVSELSRTIVSVKRLTEVFSIDSEYEIDGELTPAISGNIEFRNVSFKFEDETERHTLNDISFSINRGETIALVGKTGSGKSTLISLLIRLEEATGGEILFDGTPLKDISKKWIRKNVGVILQEPFLFAKTVRDNIGIVDQATEDKNIRNVAEVACIANDIDSFKEGFQTLVGERGVTLSGGQKQRVAIARMLLKPKPILIFDDSLSAVDNETDRSIRQALKTTWSDVTMFIVTHKITTAAKADKILVLNDGKIESFGTHNELVEKDGIYKKLWDIQSQGKLVL